MARSFRAQGRTITGTVGYQLKRAQHLLRLAMDAELRREGVTTPQYAVLEGLREADGLSGAELARQAFVSAQTMNEILVGLERLGLISRQPHPTHGRVLQASLMDAGRAKLAKARRLVSTIEAEMLSDLSADERVALFSLLRRCADRLDGAGLRSTQPVTSPAQAAEVLSGEQSQSLRHAVRRPDQRGG